MTIAIVDLFTLNYLIGLSLLFALGFLSGIKLASLLVY